MKIFGVIGWKNSGKTGLVERLVAEISARGFTVSTVKHAHHSFDIDHPGRDSYRHRDAGAREVLLTSRNRWALMHEIKNTPEVQLGELLKKLSPVDLVLIEGFKRDSHAKVECHRATTGNGLLAHGDDTIVAVAADVTVETRQPLLELDDTNGIADFVLQHTGLTK
ncbi:MAG: molybdopterin-guanine dinucleotide biosynthesis protein B [Rhodobacteraceae bacterium]|nr:molybdopterin-guanine dinucleotide biosynthesis protein B [Paracoccaceae bacterium]